MAKQFFVKIKKVLSGNIADALYPEDGAKDDIDCQILLNKNSKLNSDDFADATCIVLGAALEIPMNVDAYVLRSIVSRIVPHCWRRLFDKSDVKDVWDIIVIFHFVLIEFCAMQLYNHQRDPLSTLLPDVTNIGKGEENYVLRFFDLFSPKGRLFFGKILL